MNRISINTFAAVLILAPTIAPAQTAPAKEKRICKSKVEIGRLTPTRTCHTAAEWDAIKLANERTMQQVRQEYNPGTQNPQ